MTTITTAYLTNIDELYLRQADQQVPQPTYVALDLVTGELTARINDERTPLTHYPAAIRYGTLRWYAIPCLTTGAANRLLGSAAPIAQRIADGATFRRNADHVLCADLDSAASVAEDELIALCSASVPDADIIIDSAASDWLADDIDTLGITADTTDAALADIADEIEETARTGDQHTILLHTLDTLTGHRDGLRADVRAELAAVVKRRDALTGQRDTLIRRLRSWGDSYREIAPYAGVTHTQVSTIIRNAPRPAPSILDQLNAYAGDNIWQDVIYSLADEARTDEVDEGANDAFALADGTVIRYDEQRGEWYAED